MQNEQDVISKLGGSTTAPTFEIEIPPAGGTPPPAPEPPAGGDPPKAVTPFEVFGEEFKDRQWDDIKSDYTTRVQREKELQAQLEEAQGRQPEFADPEVAEYNAWIKNGGNKDYNLFQRIKTVGAETADIDALVLQRVAENPAFAGHEEMLKTEILNDLPIVSTEEKPLTEQQIAFNKAKISEKANSARQYLQTLQQKLQLPATVASTDKAAQLEKRKGDWTAATDTIISTIKTIPLQRMVKDGDKESLEKVLDYQLPDHLVQPIKEQVLSYFPNHADATPEAIQSATAAIMKNVVFDNLPQIINSILGAEKVKWEEEYAKTYGGAVLPKSPGGGNNGAGVTDVVQGAKEHFKNK